MHPTADLFMALSRFLETVEHPTTDVPPNIYWRLRSMSEKLDEVLASLEEQRTALANAQGSLDSLQEKSAAVFAAQAVRIETQTEVIVSLQAEIDTLKANGVDVSALEEVAAQIVANNDSIRALTQDAMDTAIPVVDAPPSA